MKKLIVLALALVCVLSFGSCGDTEKKENDTIPNPTNTIPGTTEPLQYYVPVEWPDFIKMDGVTYNGDWRETEVSPDRIGAKIGKVSSGVPQVYTDGKGNIFNLEPNDGASYLCEIGTQLFSILDSDNAIAALVDGKYYLYTAN